MRGDKGTRSSDLFTIKLALVAGTLLGLYSPELTALGDVPWAPTPPHYVALERAGDCGIFRSVAGRVRVSLAEMKRSLEVVKHAMAERRTALDACAKQKGVQVIDESSDEALAEACPATYQAWLVPGYRYYALKEDIQSEGDALRLLERRLGAQCAAGGLVQVVNDVKNQ